MNPIGNIVQKAIYLGIGLASVATEKAGSTLNDLRGQAVKLTEDLVERGEMTTDEARKFVDDLMRQAQQPPDRINTEADRSPQSIEILDDEPPAGDKSGDVENLRDKLRELQEELRRLKQ